MKLNPYIIIGIIYFFLNSVFLPFGLTYTALLSPFFYIWVTRKTGRETLLPFIFLLIIFSVPHFYDGVNIKAYTVSLLNYIAVYIFCTAFYVFLKHVQNPDLVFRFLLIINFLLCILAIALYYTDFASVVWMNQDLSRGLEDVSRLKLFTYEASYYALLFVPLSFYFILQICKGINRINAWILLIAVILPFMLSFSLGTISAVLIAWIVLLILYFRRLILLRNFRTLFFLSITAALISLLISYLFFPSNELFLRIENIIAGDDTSGKGRTSDAFFLASEIISQKSALWGVGPGQIKILGADIVRSFYLYNLDYETIAIPNAVAETYAIFGWIGLIIRFVILGSLFYFTKVWTNYYRMALFSFMFVYQFTGSFITNIAEYVIWIIAFSRAFEHFNVRQPSGRNYAYYLAER